MASFMFPIRWTVKLLICLMHLSLLILYVHSLKAKKLSISIINQCFYLVQYAFFLESPHLYHIKTTTVLKDGVYFS